MCVCGGGCTEANFVFVTGREIIDNTGKENGINIVMPERTYHLIAESAEDAR